MEIRIIKSPSPGTVDIRDAPERISEIRGSAADRCHWSGTGQDDRNGCRCGYRRKSGWRNRRGYSGKLPAEYDTAGDLRRYSVCRVSTCTDQTGSGRRKQVLMITARLTDHIWSTRKAESLNGLETDAG